MGVAHYRYLVLKMPSPTGVLTVQSDQTAAIVAVEKLHALAVGLGPVAGAEGSNPSSSCAKAPAKAPKVRPSDTDDVPVKTIQVFPLGIMSPIEERRFFQVDRLKL
jgi:hypothetical protein